MEQNAKEILESVDRVKVSIVMQVNLSDYPESRSDAIGKFHRAVESFKNQMYKNCELIIVSDGCNKAYMQYNRSYTQDLNIRFVYFDRTGSPAMYEELEGGSKYYRGFARGLGVAAATGQVITYMDSDDYLMPDFTMTCMLAYNTDPEKSWWMNTSWYDSSDVIKSNQNIQAIVDPNTIEDTTIENLPGTWKAMRVQDDKAIMSPWLFMHKSNLNVKWRDTISVETTEDVDFYNRVISQYKNGTYYSRPVYARCHYKDVWDV